MTPYLKAERVLGGVRIIHPDMKQYEKVLIQRVLRPVRADSKPSVAPVKTPTDICYSFLAGVVCGLLCTSCAASVVSLWTMCAIMAGALWYHH